MIRITVGDELLVPRESYSKKPYPPPTVQSETEPRDGVDPDTSDNSAVQLNAAVESNVTGYVLYPQFAKHIPGVEQSMLRLLISGFGKHSG